MSTTIFHITSERDWHQALQLGFYQSLRFDEEKFIHCSAPHQVLKVLKNNYQGLSGLVLLEIEQEAILAPVVYEGDSDLFPHIYGKLNIGAVRGAFALKNGDQLPHPLRLYKDVLIRPACSSDLIEFAHVQSEKVYVAEKQGYMVAVAEGLNTKDVRVVFQGEVDKDLEKALKDHVSF